MQVIEELLLERNYQSVAYLGDGRGDFCPCTRLGPDDHILARQHYPDGSPCGLLQLLADNGASTAMSNKEVAKQHSAAARACSAGLGSTAAASRHSGLQHLYSESEIADVTGVSHSVLQTTCQGDAALGQSDAQEVDKARYQGASHDIGQTDDSHEVLPPPPPVSHGLHFLGSESNASPDASSEQASCHWASDATDVVKQHGVLPMSEASCNQESSDSQARQQPSHRCVATVRSWASSEAAAMLLASLLL